MKGIFSKYVLALIGIVLTACPAFVLAKLTIKVHTPGEQLALEGAVLTARRVDQTPLRGLPANAQVNKPTLLSMEQINRQFRPFILPVPINVPVEFPNRDKTAHHVYSFSPVRTFELPLYKGVFPEPLTFTEPGVVPLGCNIHDWMIGYIVVVDTPFYTQIFDESAEFDNLVAGSYEINIWHPSIENRQPQGWIVEVTSEDASEVLSISAPLLAVKQPVPPIERFDEQEDY